MNWASKHPIEIVADCGAPLLLAIAAGWAATAAGLPLAVVASAASLALAIGVAAMRLSGTGPNAAGAPFEPVPFEAAVQADELLLDDPLIEIEADSRVVELFARQEPTPGELVLRIEDYLSDGRRSSAHEVVVEQRPVDASAALHAALANIRATLR